MTRRLRLFLATFLFGLVFITAGCLYIATTESGLQWLYARLESALAGKLSLKSVHGRLIGPLLIEELHYQDKDVDLKIAGLQMDWTPGSLWLGRLRINQLHAQGISLSLQAADPTASPTPLPDIHLPLPVLLEDVQLQGLQIKRSGGEIPFTLDRIQLNAVTRFYGTRIKHLRIDGPDFFLAAQGKALLRRSYPVDLQVSWGYTPKGHPSLGGTGRLSGDGQRLISVQQIHTPLKARIAVEVRSLSHQPRWRALAHIQNLHSQKLNADWPELLLQARVRAEGDFQQLHAQATLALEHSAWGKLNGVLRIQADAKEWHVDALQLITPEGNGRLQAQAVWRQDANPPSIQGQLTWQSLDWPLKGAAWLTSPQGELQFSGSLDNYNFNLKGEVSRVAGKLVKTAVTAQGQGNTHGLAINTWHADLLNGTLDGHVKLTWQPAWQWQAGFNAQALNPGVIWPAWPGKLALQAETQGSAGKTPGWQIQVKNLTGNLLDKPVKFSTQLHGKHTAYQLSEFNLAWGQSRLSAEGKLGESWDLRWALQAPQLHTLLPQLAGDLYSNGWISGNADQPRIVAKLDAKQLIVGTYAADTLQANIDVDGQDLRDSQIIIDAQGLQIPGELVEAVTLEGSGRLRAHRLHTRLRGSHESLSAVINAHWTGERWHGDLLSAHLESLRVSNWQLQNPTAFNVDKTGLTLDPHCWRQDAASLCGQGEWRPREHWQLSASGTQLPQNLFQFLLPPGNRLSGSWQGETRWQADSQGNINAKLQINAGTGTLYAPNGGNQENHYSHQGAELQFSIAQERLHGRFTLALGEEKTAVQAQWRIPFTFGKTKPAADQSLQGQLHLNLDDLSLLPLLFPNLEQTQGRVRADLNLAGNAQRPRVSGQVHLDGGAATIPRLGIRLQDVQGNIAGRDGLPLQIVGSLSSGSGVLNAHGELDLRSLEHWSAQIILQGNNVEVVKLTDISAKASPDLSVQIHPGKIKLLGKIHIPQAQVRTHEIRDAVEISADTRMVGDTPPTSNAKAWDITTRLQLILGDKVRFDGYNFTGWITGSLLAVDQPHMATTGLGELQFINGRYKVYGQDLDIERGRLIFASGPIDDPGLDVRAARKIGDVLAGVQARGTLKSPQLTLFSEPAMNQADTLSYLVLGRPINQVAGSESDVLLQAASSIGLAGGELLIKKIGNIFGIEEIRIQSGSTQDDTSLVIGKYLSPQLYVNYGIGLFEPVNTLRLRYRLSKRWQIQTETGKHSGGDLLYSIER